MMTAVTRVETETVITTGVDGVDGVGVLGHARDLLIATTALATTANLGTDATVVTGLDMVETGMRIAGIPSVRPLPSLLKMNGIAALCLFSSSQPVYAPES